MEGKVSSDLKLLDLRDAANSFQQSFTLQWKDIVDRLESSNNAIEGRDEELREKENSISVRLQRLEKQEAELESVKVSLEARLREVVAKEEECDRLLEELGLKEKEVEEKQKGLELKERECEKKVEEFERLKQIASKGWKVKEKELENRHKEVELKEIQCKKKLEEHERLKQSASEALKLKESEIEKRREVVELKEMQCKKNLEELERMNQMVSEASKLKEFELEKQRKEVKLKEVQCKKRLEEFVRLKQSVYEASKLKEFELEKQRKEVELKEVQFKKQFEELIRLKQSVSETSKLKEKELEKQQKGVELKEIEFIKKLEELERSKQIDSEALKLKEKEVEKQPKEIELKEMQCKKKLEELERDKESVLKDLKIKQDHVEKQRKDLELKEKYLDEQFRALRSNEMETKKYSEELNARERKCESNSKETESEKKKILAHREEVDLENLKFIEQVRNEEEKIDQKSKGFEMEKAKFMERLKELESKEKQLEVRFRELEMKEKKAADIIYNPVKKEPPDIDNVPADASLCFNVKMDGKALQLFLNEREKDHESLRNEVTTALSFSPNPAKLVLDAIQGFFPPHLKKGEIEFKQDVVRGNCILLLEQLRKISPAIKPHVRNEATELAFDWKRQMRADTEHSMEVLGFLQLLAAYKLASEFDANDLLHYLEIVAHDSQAPELFRILGFAVHIFSFIQTLTRKKKRIEAIGFVYAFDLASEFPPVPLLKDFLKFSRSGARKGRKFKNFDAKIEALNQRIEDVKAALKCIQDQKIVSDISPKGLKLQINDLEKQIAEMKKKQPMPVCTASSNHLDVRTESSLNVAAAVTSGCKLISAPSTGTKVVSTAAVHPATKTLWHQQTGIKRPRSAIADDSDVPLEEILPQKLIGSSGNEVHRHTSAVKIEQPSGESFELLQSEHGISDSLHNENSIDRQLDFKPAEYALDAIKKFCSLERKNDMSASLGISMERCISLLESLKNMSHLLDPRVKGEALKFTADWKARLMETRECQSEVVLFVEFLAAYGLTSSFPANDLLSLLDANSGRKTAFDLCQTLGLADKIPYFIESLIQRNQRIEASKYVHVLGINDKFPIIRLLSDHWDYSKKNGQRLCEKYNHSITSEIKAMREERDALTAIIKCFEAYNLQPQGLMSPEILRERIVQLEKQKAEKEVELDRVKPSARSKSISLQQQKKSANCSTEATPNAGLNVPEICPNPTVVSAPITVSSQSPVFSPTVVPKPVTISSPSATSVSIDKSAPARTVNLPLNTVPPTLLACSSAAPTTSTIVTSAFLPATPTYKLPTGSSPLPTAGAAAAKAVAPSSTSGRPSSTIPKTQHQQQGSSPLPTAGAAATAKAVAPSSTSGPPSTTIPKTQHQGSSALPTAAAKAVAPSSTSGPPSTTSSKTQHRQQGSSPLPTAGAATAAKSVAPSSTSGPPSTTIFKTQHRQQGSSRLPTAGGAAAAKAVAPSSTIGPPSTTISKTQHQQQAQNKRRKVASSEPPLKHKHMNSVVHPMQPPRHQQQAPPLINQDALCWDPPARYYSTSEDFPRTIFLRGSYYDNTSRR